jgi:hypothetical protein
MRTGAWRLHRFRACGDRKICYTCVKNSKKKRIGKRYICKSCWSDMGKRKKHKSQD